MQVGDTPKLVDIIEKAVDAEEEGAGEGEEQAADEEAEADAPSFLDEGEPTEGEEPVRFVGEEGEEATGRGRLVVAQEVPAGEDEGEGELAILAEDEVVEGGGVEKEEEGDGDPIDAAAGDVVEEVGGNGREQDGEQGVDRLGDGGGVEAEGGVEESGVGGIEEDA